MPEIGSEEIAAEPDAWDIAANESIVQREDRSHIEPDLMTAISKFCHWYPGEFKNGSIPWRTFWLMYHEIPRLYAQRQYDIAEGTRTGYGFWKATRDGASTLRKLHKENWELSNGK